VIDLLLAAVAFPLIVALALALLAAVTLVPVRAGAADGADPRLLHDALGHHRAGRLAGRPAADAGLLPLRADPDARGAAAAAVHLDRPGAALAADRRGGRVGGRSGAHE
jgi:hypothetical protein